jgi:hypothetical protein
MNEVIKNMERWKFDSFYDEEEKRWVFYKIREHLVWRVFIRPALKHIYPCPKCQEILNEAYEKEPLDFILHTPLEILQYYKCEVLEEIRELLRNSTLILGNKDYEPPIELSRSWEDIDGTFVELTENEYRAQKH